MEHVLRLLHLSLDFLDDDGCEDILLLVPFELLNLELGVPVESIQDLVDFEYLLEAVVLGEVILLEVKPARLLILVGQAASLVHVGRSPARPVLLRCKQGRVAG